MGIVRGLVARPGMVWCTLVCDNKDVIVEVCILVMDSGMQPSL